MFPQRLRLLLVQLVDCIGFPRCVLSLAGAAAAHRPALGAARDAGPLVRNDGF